MMVWKGILFHEKGKIKGAEGNFSERGGHETGVPVESVFIKGVGIEE